MLWTRIRSYIKRQTLRRIGVLQMRAAMALLIGICSFGGLLVYVDQEITERALKKELFDQSMSFSRIVAAMVEERLNHGQLTEVDTGFRETLQQIARSANIEHGVIHDAQQGMSLEFRPDTTFFLEHDIWPCVEEVLETGQFASRVQQDQMAVAVPLLIGGKLRGAVSVIQTKEFFAYKRGEAVLRASFIVGGFSAIFVPVMLLLLSRLLKPLNLLTRAARQLAGGHLPDLATSTSRRDEIGMLSRAFGRMATTIRKNSAAEKRLANTDPVTGLANRARIETIIAMAAQTHATTMQPWSIFFIDLDKFKRVNDTLGHQVGDEVLMEAGRRISAVCAEQGYHVDDPLTCDDMMTGTQPLAYNARFGGDEFDVVTRSALQGEASPAELGQAIIAALQRPIRVDAHAIDIGASIGISMMPEHGTSPTSLLRYADLAMYAIKKAGGTGCRIYSEELSDKAVSEMIVEMDLHRALGEGEIVPFYMPKIRFSNGKISGFEALARWHHREKGLIPPDRFIPIAEERGLITEIDRAILRQAAKQAVIWWKQGLVLPIAVNVAPVHFERDDFVEYVERVINDTGVPGFLLELEFTETAAMGNSTDVVEKVSRLKKLGVRFAIDDFGTGYSNLAQLRRLPVDVLKIDRSLTRHIETDSEANLVIQTVIAMTQQMKLEIVVEGVENDEQSAILGALGCTYAQGYLYGAPKSLDDTTRLLAPMLVPASAPARVVNG